jgi:ribonuclease P protein component
VRVAVAASRAVGGAVKRNRARRRVREALRIALGARPDGGRGADILVIVRPAALAAPAADMRRALERELDRVLG